MTPENATAAGVATDGGQRRDSGPGATNGKGSTARRHLVATFCYRDDGGAPIYRKLRYEWRDSATGERVPDPKTGKSKHCYFETPDGEGGWQSGLGGTQRVLYRLPELTGASADDVVFFVEGEKCVDRLRALGLIATTAGGADDWRPGFERWLAGRDVVVLPDNDDYAGRPHGVKVANAISKIARCVRVVELPGLPDGGDIVDFLDAGHTVEELHDIVAATAPWEPTEVPKAKSNGAAKPKRNRRSAAGAPSLQLTDAGNAETFVREHRDGLRWVPEWGSWVVFDGKRWRRTPTEALIPLAIKTARGFYAMAAQPGIDREQARALADHGRRSEAAGRLEAMPRLARGLLIEPAAAFNARPFDFNCDNGTIDLRTGDLHPHRREDMLSQLSPVAYDPAAAAPQWEAFLARILPSVAVRDWLQKFIGYSLTGDVREQILTFLWGGGANGKSTLLGAVQAVLGDYAFTGPPGLLLAQDRGGDELGRRQRATLLGRRFVVCQEIEAGRYLNESQVKQLTGGDKISAARLYEHEIEFAPTHKLLVAANHKPVVRCQDHAIWRRMILVPFTVTIPQEERDATLPAKLAAEGPGILAWAVRGCLDWQRGGLVPPTAIAAATEAYRADEDRLGAFLESETVRDPSISTPLAAIYKSYKAWCDRTGEREWSNKAVSAALEERGFQKDRGAVGVRFHGVRLREAP